MPTSSTNDLNLTKAQESKIIKIISDPILWAEAILKNPDDFEHSPLVLNDVEKQILSSKSRKNVIRVHRRSGKCVAQNERIPLSTGERVKAKDLIGKQFSLLTITDSGIIAVPALAEYNEVEPVYELTTESGRKIIRNADHPLFCATKQSTRGRPIIKSLGWTPLKDISNDQLVAITEYFKTSSTVCTSSEDELKVLAYLLGDGGYTGKNIVFTQQNNKQLKEFHSCIENLGGRLTALKHKDQKYGWGVRGPLGVCNGPKGKSNPIINLLRNHKMMHVHSRDKCVPEFVFTLSKPQIALFLNRLFSTDGWAYVRPDAQHGHGSDEIGFCSVSERLVRDVQELLLYCGICSTIRYRQKVNAWVLEIHRASDRLKFCEHIGIYGKEDKLSLLKIKAVKIATSRSSSWRHDKAPETTRWEKVVSIRCVGKDQTIAIAVPNHNTYLTTFYEHNSYSLTIRALWRALTHESSQVLIICPDQPKVDTLFELINEFIRVSPGLEGSVVSNQKKPSVIRFSNGSIIKGFTTGASSNREARTLRGQSADEVMVDEAAYLGKGDWPAITPIMYGDATRNVICWVASTPTAERGMYYKWCTDDQTDSIDPWRQVFMPVTKNPDYPDDKIAIIKAEETEATWYQEWMAEFPDIGEGVFKNSYVDRAQKDYYYHSLTNISLPGQHPSKNATRTMGVDWDKYSAGPNIVIVEMDMESKRYKIVYAEEIPPHEYVLQEAVDRVIALDDLFDCNHIYVDRGYGEMQVEYLHKYGLEHPYTNLHTKVEGYTFSDYIETIDPVVGKVRKPIKPLMVNILVKWMEDNKFIYSKYHKTLTKQFNDFKVIGVSNSTIKYTGENDHIIAALLLASFAMHKNFDDPFKLNAATDSYVLPMPKYINAEDAKKNKEDIRRESYVFSVERDETPGYSRNFTRKGLPPVDTDFSFQRKSF